MKKILFFLAVTLSAQTPTLTYSSTSPDGYPLAVSGNTPAAITITSSLPVAWTKTGLGTLSTISSTQATYTPPAHFVNKHQINGCPVFPNDAIWNTNISSAPVNSLSSSWKSSILEPLWTFYDSARTISYVDATTPPGTFKLLYSDPNIPLTVPYPLKEGISDHLRREGGSLTGYLYTDTGAIGAGFFNDHHIQEINKADCSITEIYGDTQPGTYVHGTASGVVNCNDGITANCNAINAAFYSGLQYSFGSPTQLGSGASGVSELVSLDTLAEIKSLSINHLARMLLDTYEPQNSYIWPAFANSFNGCVPSVCPTTAPFGAWFRLKSSYWNGTGTAPTCNSGNATEDAECDAMVVQLQNYGMFVADGSGLGSGSNGGLSIGNDVTQDPVALAAANEVKIAISNFDAIDPSGAAVNPTTVPSTVGVTSSSIQVKPTGTIPITQYASITATPISTGTAITTPVILQGVGIGLKSQFLYIKSGTSYQLSYWVEPLTASQIVTWSASAGSITSAGLYTAPTIAANAPAQTAVLTGVAGADSGSTIQVFVTIIPTSNDGSLRFADFQGTSGNVTDAETSPNLWYSCCLQGPYGVISVGPAIPTSSTPEAAVYTNSSIAAGDMRMDLALTPGNYKVRMMWSVPTENYCGQVCGTVPVGPGAVAGSLSHNTITPLDIDTQGQIAHFFDPLLANHCLSTYACPSDYFMPATVGSDGNFYLTLHEYVSDTPPYIGGSNSQKLQEISGIQIIPDSTPAHLAIQVNQVTNNCTAPTSIPTTSCMTPTITAGDSVQMWPISWYISGFVPASTVWSLTTNTKATIVSNADGSATVSLPSGSTTAAQTILITATNGAYSATTTLYTGSAQYVFNPTPPVNHYSFVRTIVVNHSKVNGTQSNYPLTVTVSDPTLATVAHGGHVQSLAGYDIMFAASQSAAPTPMTWEQESYDPVNGVFVAHVLIPNLSSTADTTLYLYYGNPAIKVSQSNPSAVWDSNFTGVYHMATIAASDSTSNARNGTDNGMTTATGIIDGALSAVPSSAYSVSAPGSAINASAGTVSGWTYNTVGQSSSPFIFFSASDAAGDRLLLGYWNGSQEGFGWLTGGGDYRIFPNPYVLSANTWHLITYTWDSSLQSQSIYLDGSLALASSAAFTTFTPNSVIIGDYASNPSYNWIGSLDEIRVSKIQRGASWIATEYANQSSPSTFLSVGSETAN